MIGLLLLCLLALAIGLPVGRRLPLPKHGQVAIALTLGTGAVSLWFAALF